MITFCQAVIQCLCAFIIPSIGQLLLINNDIDVPVGREIYLTKENLQFRPFESSEICKVEVVANEPMTQRVGLLEPQVFDCNFHPKTVKYTHFGSTLLTQDDVKFWAYKFTENETVSERFAMIFNILNLPYNITQIIGSLVVKEFFGLSNPLDDNVLSFRYNKNNGAVCKARFTRFQSKRPAHGQIVVGVDKRPIDVIKRRCDDFLKLGLRYEHFKPPSPNIDYIMIIVEVSDPLLNGGEPVTEWVQLPVVIQPGFPNLQPKASFSSMYLMDVDQFILTTITSAVLSALDGETPSELLTFNISKPLDPINGTIVHLSDHTRPVTSFLQADVNSFQIAYKPPTRSFKNREMFEIVFNIFDADFASSDPVTLHIAVRAAVTSAPRVSVNTGLILLEGQSRPILPENLEIVDSDNIDDVKIFITGGLLHGRLEIDGMPGIVFSPWDLKENKVIYFHDDSDTTKDSIHFRIYDGSHSTHTKFPISIIPKDDNIPALVMNIGLKAEEGGTVKISSDVLSAHDKDTSDEFVIFLVTKPPVVGVIWKMFLWEKTGTEVNRFTQRDINKGIVFYHHFGSEVFVDEFEITLQDMSEPPNRSPPYKVSVLITPVRDDPPKKTAKASLFLEVSETDIGIITKSMLHYQDSDSDDKDLVYTVTSLPRFIGSYAKSGAGKLVSLTDQILQVKDPDLPTVLSFTQEEINHFKIGYLPPIEDIGPYPLYLQFVFSVNDKHGNTVTGQIFNITLLPVNNQIPQLHTGELLVDEGSSALLSTNELSVYDPDTLTSELQISLFTVPLHGSLRRSGQFLRVGDLLSLDDILTLLLEYVHDGSESHHDSFKIGVSDGIHYTSGEVRIKIEPIDDETPVWKRGLLQEIRVEEGGEVQITSEVLAATDVDTSDTLLHFILTEVPLYGMILVDGRMVSRFTQLDVMEGKVYYKHDGQEIGPSFKRDSFTLIVTDRAFPPLSNHPSQKVFVTIQPTNSHAPHVSFRKSILVEEGQTAPITEDILSARDDDTLPSMLKYVIFQQPQHGFIENLRPRPGYEKSNKGEIISTFTQKDIKDGFINYVQSDHRGTEPESDEFKVYVTDDVYNSTAVLIIVSIILRNDEEPQVTLHNITVKEGGFQRLNGDVLSVTDRDFPGDILGIHLKSPPLFGSVVQRIQHRVNGHVVELPFSELPIDRFYQNVVYQHDDSENFLDRFTVVISDGVHDVIKTMYVEVQPINDEIPKLVKNIKANVKPGASFLLSSAYLLASDEDTLAQDISYKIIESPREGKLQKKDVNGIWKDMKYPFYFTQKDANLNFVRYQHMLNESHKNEDSFSFVLSDKVHNSSVYIFKIGITHLQNSTLSVFVKSPTVIAKSYIIINTSILIVNDSSNNLENVMFEVIQPPKFGHLELISHPGVTISQFQLLDIIGRKVLYNHTDSDSNNSVDSFIFFVSNGSIKKKVVFNLNISYPLMEEYNLPILQPVHPVFIFNKSAVISGHNLNTTDFKLPEDKIFYLVVEEPKYGTIQKNNKKVKDFTQADINRGLITYHHLDSSSTTDSLLFEVTNKQGVGYLLDGKLQRKATKLDIFIKHKLPPTFPHITLLEQMEYFGTGRSGFILSTDVLQRTDNTSTRQDLTYTISQPPQYGYLVYRETGKPVNGAITQKDINNHRITFVINGEKQDVTNDSVTFRIINENGNIVAEQRLDLQWAIVYFAYPEYVVCEDAGTIDIEVLRAGDISQSSFVTVNAIGQSAYEGEDYLSGRSKLIQFDPGVTSAVWKLQILDDNLEESTIEQIQILLANPVNAVISKSDITLISIHDKRNNECPDLPAPVVRVSQEKFEESQADVSSHFEAKGVIITGSGSKVHSNDRVLGKQSITRQICTVDIYGLLRYNYSTGKLDQCDGQRWIPWQPRSRLDDDILPFSKDIQIEDVRENFEITKNETKRRKEQKSPKEPKQKKNPKIIPPCSKGWKMFEEKCYKWFKNQISWNEAEETCRNEYNGHLATVISNDHNLWLMQLTRNRPFWIGLHFPVNGTEWTYTSSQSISFANWKNGFPRISKRGNIKLKCVLVRGSGQWINRQCEQHNHSYICVRAKNKEN